MDLGLEAGVSTRHISFLETGRSGPSREMVLLLSGVLNVPKRDTNQLLVAAGFDPHYPEPSVEDALTGPLSAALQAMLDHHEPFPMVVFNRLYEILSANRAGTLLAAELLPAGTDSASLVRVLFESDPDTGPVVNWKQAAATILRQIQRDAVHAPQDLELRALLDDLLEVPGVPEHWKEPDLAAESESPVMPVRFRLGDGAELAFLTTITTFSGSNNVTLDELRIESYFPLDETTEQLCRERLTA